MRAARFAVLLITLLAAVGCGESPSQTAVQGVGSSTPPTKAVMPPREPPPSAASVSRSANGDGWHEPADYQFVLRSNCGERALLGRFHIEVEAHQVVAVRGLNPDGKAFVEHHRLDEVPTLGGLVAAAEDARAKGAAVARVKYGSPDGQPVRVEIGRWTTAHDDAHCYTVTRYSDNE